MVARGVVVDLRDDPVLVCEVRGRTTPPNYVVGDPPGDKWHLDEVFVINGATHYLWRAVDQHGDVLDILVQSRRNAVAARRFFRSCSRACRYVPRVLVTDKLASYQVAHRRAFAVGNHTPLKVPLNNRAGSSISRPESGNG